MRKRNACAERAAHIRNCIKSKSIVSLPKAGEGLYIINIDFFRLARYMQYLLSIQSSNRSFSSEFLDNLTKMYLFILEQNDITDHAVLPISRCNLELQEEYLKLTSTMLQKTFNNQISNLAQLNQQLSDLVGCKRYKKVNISQIASYNLPHALSKGLERGTFSEEEKEHLLLLSISAKSLDCFQVILAHYDAPNALLNKDNIQAICRVLNSEIMTKALVKQFPALINKKSRSGDTLLGYAILCNAHIGTQVLLSNGGKIPESTLKCSEKISKLLLHYGAEESQIEFSNCSYI